MHCKATTPGRWPEPWLVALLLAVAVTAAPAANAAELRELRLTASPESTRVEFSLDGAVVESVFRLANPARIVVDLKPATFDRHRVALPAGQGLVRAVRIGARAGGGLRIVLDVDAAVAVRRVPVAAGADPFHRIGVELVSASAPTAPSAPAAPAAPSTPGESLPAAGRTFVVAVDAGHGGEDPGASGRDGTREKDVTLAVARVLAQRIGAVPGMRAVLTRDGDYFVPLRERIHRARVAQADLFVSVHADAVPNRSISGSSVYVLSARGATSEAAKWLADRENAADLVGGVSLDDKDGVLASVLLDLSQSAAMSASMAAAQKVLNELNAVGAVRKARVQQAGFVVLKSPDIPSVLIETAYITNPGEERHLRDPRYQSRLADAILTGVRSYFRDNPPPGARVAALTYVPGAGATGARAEHTPAH